MKCRSFAIAPGGELICAHDHPEPIVGNARQMPDGLSREQYEQISAWIVLESVAGATAPIFSITSTGPHDLAAAVRLRAAAGQKLLVERLDEDLNDLVTDLREVGTHPGLGFTAKLDRTKISAPRGGGSYIVWSVSVSVDPLGTSPMVLRAPMAELARVFQETRLGEHVMDPFAPWIPELGRKRKRR